MGSLKRIRGAAIVVGLIVIQLGILLATAWDKSDTADEPRYLSSGATILAHGGFRDLCEAPVLPKLAFGAALRLAALASPAPPLGWQDTMAQLLDGPSPDDLRRLFFAARCATILVTVLGGLMLWRAATRFGPSAGIVALALWVFSPTVLANGSLAALDVWAASLVCAVVLASMRFVERPSLARTVALGVAVGLTAGTKVPALLIVPVGLTLLATVGRRAVPLRSGPLLARVALVGGTALFTLWGLYGFTVGGVDWADPCPFLGGSSSPTPGVWPFPAWVEGVVFQLRHASDGHANYLFGELGSEGWWWFYLAAFALKTTVGLQLLVAVTVVATLVAVRRRLGVNLWIDAALLAFPAALFVVVSLGRHQPNVSFLLPAFPLAIVWLARGITVVESAFGVFGRRLFWLLLLVAAVESVSVHPHHLMFFNVWGGGPEGGHRYLIHREDWGQDKRRLALWQRDNAIPVIRYAPYGPVPGRWGVVYEDVPCGPAVGVYALHAVEVHRPQFALRPGCVDWLTIEPPDERLGYSIYIYRVDEDRLARLAQKRDQGVPPFWRSGTRD